MLATGLLAASASSLAILQPPASWSDLFLLSQPVAAAGELLYHTVNAYRLASSGRHLTATAARSDRRHALRLRRPGPAGIGRPDAILGGVPHGRARVDAARGDGVPRARVRRLLLQRGGGPGLGLATKGKPLRSLRAHLAMLAVAAAAVAAPVGSRPSGRARPWPHGPACSALVATVLTTMLSQAGLWAEAYLVTGMAMDAIHGQAPSRESAFGHPVTGMKKAMVYGGIVHGEPLHPRRARGNPGRPMGGAELSARRCDAGRR